MAYTHDIPFDESNRANRRRSNPNVKRLQQSLIETKALPKIGDLRFDPNAEDGDGDGLVQDNTPYERPSIIKPSLPKFSGLASTTGSSDVFWSKGLTNEELAERAIPDNPADFLNMRNAFIAHTGATGNLVEGLDELVNDMSFDQQSIKRAREILVESLDARPAWREAVDDFGMPPIGILSSESDNAGFMFGAHSMYISESELKKVRLKFKPKPSKSKIKVFSDRHNAPTFKGMPRLLVGGQDTLFVHEWGHYLNYLAVSTHPDEDMRHLASFLYSDRWDIHSSYVPQLESLRRMYMFQNSMPDRDREHDMPSSDEIPFVKSAYASSSPVEFFAEAVTSYFGLNDTQRNAGNEASRAVVELMLGRRGLASRSGIEKRSTGSSLHGMTPKEIAERVVPSNKEQARALVEEHWLQLATPEQSQLPIEEVRKIIDKAMAEIFENSHGWDNLDFHPDQVKTLRDHLESTFANNPDFHEAVQRLGMPPLFFTSPDAQGLWGRRGGVLAAAMAEHFPMIALNPKEFERERIKGPRKNKRPLRNSIFGGVGISGTKKMVVSSDYEGTVIHEWGHYLNKTAAFMHPDEDVRAIGQAYWMESYGELTFIPDNYSAVWEHAEAIMDAQLGGDKLDPEVPFVLTHYGQISPAETFAEGVSAMLSGDRRNRDLVSPGLQKDIRTLLGLDAEEDSLEAIRADRRGLASTSSSANVVTRDPHTDVRKFRDPFSPLSGTDWLKDATRDEIAEAVIPMNLDDAITMMTQIICYGIKPNNKQDVRAMKAMLKQVIDASIGYTQYDFSPAGRQRIKDTILNAFDESPGFEYLVRKYGLPPILGIEPGIGKKLQSIYNQPLGELHKPESRFTMGMTLGNMFIIMNYDSDVLGADMPSGFIDYGRLQQLLPNISGGMRDTGTSLLTGNKMSFIKNFGFSRADTLRHEYAHWFWNMHIGSPYTYGQSGPRGAHFGLPDMSTNRTDRARFISKATGESIQAVLKRMEGLKFRFEDSRLTLRNDLDRVMKDGVMLGYLVVDPSSPIGHSLVPHPDAPNHFGGSNGANGTQLWELTVGRLTNPATQGLWSPEDVWLTDSAFSQVHDQIENTMYANYPLPMLRGGYANASAQELFAESVALFLGPDGDLWKRYATESLLDSIAEGFNFASTPNGGIITPWEVRSLGPNRGLASRNTPRNANETLLSRTLIRNDRLAVSQKPDSDITPSTVTEKAPGVFSFSTGSDKWDFIVGEDPSTQWETAYANWVSRGGQDSMREASASLMGIGQVPTGEKDDVRGSMIDSFVAMSMISQNGEPSEFPSYRAMSLVNSDSEIMTAEIGKPLAMPLTSFSPDSEIHMEIRRQRTGVNDNVKDSGNTVIMRLAPGASVAKPMAGSERAFRNADGDTVTGVREYVTQGRFAITGRQTLPDGTVLVDIEQTHTFNPKVGKLQRTGIKSIEQNPFTSVKDKYQESLDGRITEREDYIANLSKALQEWETNGVWNGEDYGVVVNPSATPRNITKEEMEEGGFDTSTFVESVHERIKDLNVGLTIMKDSRDRAKSQPNTTTQIEAILEDQETLARLDARAIEVQNMSLEQRREIFDDGEYQYVVHWGADTLDGGVLDPSRSRGDESINNIAGNTRLINQRTAQTLVAERDHYKERLDAFNKIKESFDSDGLIDLSKFDNPRSIQDALGFITTTGHNRHNVRDGEQAYRPWPDAQDLEAMGVEELTPELKKRIMDNLDATIYNAEDRLNGIDTVADKLIESDYQYSSTYPAESLVTATGYGGRYGEGETWGNDVSGASRTGIHVFRIKIGDDATKDTHGPGEVHIIGKHTPVASLSVETHRNLGPQPGAGLTTWKGWLVEAVEQDKKRRAGMSSRSSRVIGDGPIVDRVTGELKLTEEQKNIVDAATESTHESFVSGKIYDEPIHADMDNRRKELLDSIRVTVASDGIPMIMAEPNPILNSYLPTKRDWSSIELPERDLVLEAFKKLLQNNGDGPLDTESDGHSKFLNYLYGLIDALEQREGAVTGEFLSVEGESPSSFSSYIQQYHQSLRDPAGSSRILYYSDGLHDAFGHFGTGRGYDRHGEWANYLAMKDMIDNAPGLTDEERHDAHRFWFREYALPHLNMRGEQNESNTVHHELQGKIAGYNGDFQEILDLLDSGKNGKTTGRTGMASRSGTKIADMQVSELQKVAQLDIAGQLNRRGVASRSSKASAKRITKNFKVNGKPRKKPQSRQELVSRGVPSSPSELFQIIKDSPYTNGKKSEAEILDLIRIMDVDWTAQAKLSAKLDKVFADSPVFEELLGEYDIPLMLVTKFGASKSSLGYTDNLYTDPNRWNHIEGEYMSEYGFIAFPSRIVNQDTVTNKVSDGPLATEDIIRHELSHTIHAMAMAKSRKARKKYEEDTRDFVGQLEEALKYAEESGADVFDISSVSPFSGEEHALAGEVSRYAQTKRSEYIAELLTHMLPGKKTKFVALKDEHFEMLSEFLDIPVARLRDMNSRSMSSRVGWATL